MEWPRFMLLITKNYREGMICLLVTESFFNHESARRGEVLSPKITMATWHAKENKNVY
jgi:GDP-D-mannose dehydratase